MGLISGLEKKIEGVHLHHHEQHQQPEPQPGSMPSASHSHAYAAAAEPAATPKSPQSPSSVAASVGSSNAAGPLRHVRHSSLKIRTDSANNEAAALPPQPKTAGLAKPQSPLAETGGSTPRAAAAAAPSPIMIKRNTSFSQRLHNLLHRDKPQKHSPAVGGAGVQGRHNGAGGHETPTIAYRTPTTQTQSTDVSASASAAASAGNSPPAGISPRGSSANMASAAYHAQRGFEPVPEDKVFAVSNINLRSVQHHRSQIRRSIDQGPAVHQESALSTLNEPAPPASRGSSPAPSVSREPSQHTLHPSQSGADMHGASAKATTARAEPEESALAGKTLPAKPTDADIARNREQLAAGTTRDLQPAASDAAHPCSGPCAKKAGPVYSTHKAKLNQFGRQTKVIGKGTGGTVHLLRGVELDVRPPSLRSGAPSSHAGEESSAYSPSEHKLFAVKEFRKRRADETPRAYMKKVTSEFCIGSSIHQENVIETLDLIFEGERVYEIMEYCPHDLFTFVSRGNMGLGETFCWFKQVCRGVQYLHTIGIAHRDLKLENCLLTERGIVKIIDFGCATVFKTPFQKEPSKVVGVCGSDPYIAPEVLMSRRQVPYYAQAADIWSVGIMYMCMTLLKFPWRIAETEVDRCYGSYIREWPRGRDKLFAQLPKLAHGGHEVIQGMVYPESKGRLTMDQVMDSEWMRSIDTCHTHHLARSHAHHMKID
ncbi:serine/threonine protein kinase [Coemansia sp. RSA 2711]|nr:serine/threonine protein kinase [Coemansia sp. RSA 2711]